MKYYSQSNQDFVIDYFFQGKTNGTFVDLGAHDGITMSNSYFFEKERNWTGLCVEPIKEVFTKLKNNRTCHVVNGAIANSDKILEFRRNHGRTEMLSGLVEHRDKRHDKKTDREIEVYGGDTEYIQVQGYTLMSLLSKLKIGHVDYLSLDIEGGELEVLKTIDFKKCQISYLTIENNYNSKEIRTLMEKNGYKFILHYHKDDFFTKEEFVEPYFFFKSWKLFKIWSWGEFLLFIKFFKR